MNEALQVKWDLLPYINGQGLDLGCGDARPHDWFVGVDIRAGTSQLGPNLIYDATKLNGMFADGSQDFIFSSYLLNELPREQWPQILAGWWRLIREDGYLILFLPENEGCHDKDVVDCMRALVPWQFVDARKTGDRFFHVYRKCNRPSVVDRPDPDKVCAVIRLGAHGDAIWASSVLPGLKKQGYHVIFYTQETGEQVLRHDPNIDELICFSSKVPMQELGELFLWIETKYKNTRMLVETVEGTLLPAPGKIQYHFPDKVRDRLMNFNYLEIIHDVAKVPYDYAQRFYPSDEEMRWANEFRAALQPYLVVLVPNGSSCTKMWPHAVAFAKQLLAARDDVSIVMVGDTRGCDAGELALEPRFFGVGMAWDVRKCMTLAKMANVVVGEETGVVNAVAMERDVHKVVLLSHSSVENLTRDWPNTTSIRELPPCAGTSGCHRLHYDWQYCPKDEATQAAPCQAMIRPERVLKIVLDQIPILMPVECAA